MKDESKEDTGAMEALYYATLPALDELSHMGRTFVVLQWVKYVAAMWADSATPDGQSIAPMFAEVCQAFSDQVLELPATYANQLTHEPWKPCGKCSRCRAKATEGKPAN